VGGVNDFTYWRRNEGIVVKYRLNGQDAGYCGMGEIGQ
jgi:hypothetical protein